MAQPDDSVHLSARVPADILTALDKIASMLGRPRSWVVGRALSQYLDAEGAEMLRDAESAAALDRGEGHDLDAVLDEADAIIAAARVKRGTAR